MRASYTHIWVLSTEMLTLPPKRGSISVRMKELEQRTGVHREVIRQIMREGLLPDPERPTQNSAIYNEDHVTAIGAVRELQQRSRMTLKEIKATLDRGGLGQDGDSAALPHLETLLANRLGFTGDAVITVAELAERLPSAERDVRAFARLGMLSIVRASGNNSLSLRDARLVEIWEQIREAGFIEERGFPPENIAFYAELARALAAHEAAVFFDNADGVNADDAAAMLHVALPLMLEFFGLLRGKAFLDEVRQRQTVRGEPSSELLPPE